jgi:hypothetical protein
MAPAVRNMPGRLWIESLPPGLIGLGAAITLFMAFRSSGAVGSGEGPPAPPMCGTWHRGTGEGQPVDLERVRRGYVELKDRLTGSLKRGIEKAQGSVQPEGYDLGLPACTGSAARQFRPGREVPPELRGKTLWFFRLDGEKRPTLPGNVGADPSALLFAVRTDGLGTLEKASKSWGRPVGLAPRGLAEALGVRCAPALVSISGDGQGPVEIHENP